MSKIGLECKTNNQISSARLHKLCFVLATAVSCTNWLGLRSEGQTSAGSNQRTPANTPGTKNPEEQVDIDYKETNLIPMTPAAPIAILSVHKIEGGAVFKMQPGVMTVHFCNDNIVHVSYAPGDEPPTDKSLAVIGCQEQYDPPLKLVETSETISLAGDKLSVFLNRYTGALTFLTPADNKILTEPQNGGKAMQKATVNQEDTYHLQQEFLSPPDEALYGLAEGQDGVWNWRGMPIDLISQNIIGAFPIMVSSRGYGLLWDNESLTEFNPVSSNEEISLNPSSRTGVYTPRRTGDYVFFARGGDGAREIGIAVGGRVIHDDKNMWVPYTSVVKVHLTAGESYPVRLLGGGKTAKLYGRPLGNTTVFRSEAGKDISYYFIYGPNIDKVVAGYRLLTGTAPLFPKWAYGLWQCREHYSSQEETLDAAEGFRSRHIPVDLIIQDWQYWGKWGWGAYQFDPTAYPDPAEMIKKLHQLDFHYMISVWADPKGEVLDELAKHHGVIDDTGYVNEFYSQARSVRWQYLKRYMFDIGVDAWWQDGEEANGQVRNHKVYVDNLGYVSGNDYTYYYPQAANESIYEGQRSADSTKRVVQLGKTATLGFQRYAAVTWSGDVHGSWQAFSEQIPAGLNLSVGGMPYWTTDTGGFFRPKDQYSSPDYNRLLVRWFEYSTFCPILRIHGYKTETEMWKWPLAYKYLLMYDNFRYRMLPYIYSEAWRVTDGSDTLMRPLVMDFPSDRNVDNIGDQYMFGSALLVAPITSSVDRRSVYLPVAIRWTNFWTGQRFAGSQHLDVVAPLQRIPLFVRAGAILPLGPTMEYATQKPEDPIELRVYPGANGSFVLYEDENDNYDYEKGLYATIPITWNDASQTLTIGPRSGDFPGIRKDRTFMVVVVRPGHGAGLDTTLQPDRIVSYAGNPETVHVGRREN
ncbi:MAG: TIM-barrel domain-containing protein [Terriglobales bacterium]|jgi:alpha-D-xyloside xylohydrolase